MFCCKRCCRKRQGDGAVEPAAVTTIDEQQPQAAPKVQTLPQSVSSSDDDALRKGEEVEATSVERDEENGTMETVHEDKQEKTNMNTLKAKHETADEQSGSNGHVSLAACTAMASSGWSRVKLF